VVADQAEPAAPISRSRVTHQPEPMCHASGGTKQADSALGRNRTCDTRFRKRRAPLRAFVSADMTTQLSCPIEDLWRS
jgi:hypothetical protein